MLEACRTLPSCKHARTDGARVCRVRADLAEEHLDDRPDWQGRAPHTWAPLRPRSLPTAGRPGTAQGTAQAPGTAPGTAQPRACAISAVVSPCLVRPAWLARHLAQSPVPAPHAHPTRTPRDTPHSRTAARRGALRAQAAARPRWPYISLHLPISPYVGCGKTEVARRLAKLAQAPFIKARATGRCREM